MSTNLLPAVALCGLTLTVSNMAIGDEQSACMEGPMAQFGRYVGDWNISDESLARDGSGWGPGPGARWVFECVGDGVAVQDFWHPNGGGWGTNLRTYNPDTESWEISWAASGQDGFDAHIRQTAGRRQHRDGYRETGAGSAQANYLLPAGRRRLELAAGMVDRAEPGLDSGVQDPGDPMGSC